MWFLLVDLVEDRSHKIDMKHTTSLITFTVLLTCLLAPTLTFKAMAEDVQPASKEDGWDTDPFVLAEKDGKLYSLNLYRKYVYGVDG